MKRLLKYIPRNLLILTISIATTIYMVSVKAPTLQIPVIASLLIIAITIAIINNISLKLSRLILIIYSLFLGTQMSSIILTGNYIDAVALSNIDEYTAISSLNRLKIILILGGYILASLLIKLSPRRNTKKTCLALGTIIFLTAVLITKYLPLPITSLINLTYTTTAKYYTYHKTDYRIKEAQKKIYKKDYIVENPTQHLIAEVPDLSNKNIILFFSEALSAKKIDLFNNYTDLTPNLSSFIKNSLYFDNYYNHTFATFLGLRGQLSSSYQYSRGLALEKMNKNKIRQKFSTDIITLPHILNENGYHTYFLSARASSPSNLNTMLNTLGFDHVFTPEDFYFNTDLSDQQLFAQLTELISKNKLQSPYFIAIYNIGTHFAEDSPDIKYNDEKNALLNTIHNFDNAFGKWFNTLSEQPDIFNRSVIILTADHAAFANPEYQQTFEHNPQVWVDKIPLAIYTANINPQIIDAKARNSLDLAPTVLHMLRINKAKNYFLGCSLFKLYCPLPFNHYSVSKEIRYETTPEGTRYFNENSYPKHIFDRIKDFYHLSESYIDTSAETSE